LVTRSTYKEVDRILVAAVFFIAFLITIRLIAIQYTRPGIYKRTEVESRTVLEMQSRGRRIRQVAALGSRIIRRKETSKQQDQMHSRDQRNQDGGLSAHPPPLYEFAGPTRAALCPQPGSHPP